MMTDPISDMLARIRNAAMVSKPNVELPRSNMKYTIAKILEKEGYVGGVEEFKDGSKPMLRIELKYLGARQPAFESIKRISKPGRRIYAKATELPNVRHGQGIAVVSTPNGLMTNKDAKKRSLGGEVICEVF